MQRRSQVLVRFCCDLIKYFGKWSHERCNGEHVILNFWCPIIYISGKAAEIPAVSAADQEINEEEKWESDEYYDSDEDEEGTEGGTEGGEEGEDEDRYILMSMLQFVAVMLMFIIISEHIN